MSQTDHHGRSREVLDAALQLFADKGFAATSVSEIVLKAGLTKPALYYHFGSKEGLLKAILDASVTEFESRVHQKIDFSLDARDSLVKFLEACFEMAAERPQLAALMYQVSFGPKSSSAGLDVSDLVQRNQLLVMSVIDRTVREGLVAEDDIQTAALLFNGLVNIHLMAFLKGQLHELSPQLARQAVDHYLRGVARPSAGAAGNGREG